MASEHAPLLSMGALERFNSILFLKEVREFCFLSDESRDLAVQLFDAYFALRPEEPGIDNRIVIMSCLMISTKLLDSSQLPLGILPVLSPTDICHYEFRVLSTLKFNVLPLQTPSFLSRRLIELWPHSVDMPLLVPSCDVLIGKFWEHEKSVSFSPAVIAVTAVLLAIGKVVPSAESRLHLCHNFISSIHSLELESLHPIESIKLDLNTRDLNRCLDVFELAASLNYGRISPVSVIMSENQLSSTVHRPKATKKTPVNAEISRNQSDTQSKRQRV